MSHSTFTPDYAIHMQDKAGRRAVLFINGATIDEMVSWGYSRSEAVESVESNAFQNAIANGEIGEDGYIAAE